jgi:GNAT superfamily N-acetyltransferase
MSYEFGHCREDELPSLVDLANRVFRSGRAGDMGAEYPLVFEPANVENLRVARADGRIVSHVGICLRDASILGARVHVASIGAVATDPDHRGRGLASRLMEEARRHAVQQGASLMLISGGRGLYIRLGYVQVGSFLSHQSREELGEGLEVREFVDADLAAVAALYQAEPVRFFRPMSDWHRLVAAGRLMNQPADLLVIDESGGLIAYLGVQLPTPGTAGPVRVREFAGSRSAITAALPAVARRYGAATAEVVVRSCDVNWRFAARAHCLSGTPVAFPGTVGVIDPARFLCAVRPLIEERVEGLTLEPAGEGAILSGGGHRVELTSRGRLEALVFGGATAEAHAVPEIPDALGALTDAAFPLSLPWYGYNYV